MTGRITQSMIQRSLLADLNDVAQRLSHTQRKMSSGRELQRPSDDPYRTGRALALRGELEGVRQLGRNVAEASAWQEVADVALGKVDDHLLRVRELVVGAANGAAGQSSRSAAADEIDQLVEAVKQEANASYGGQHVFAGTLTTTPPYAVGGADSYLGDAGVVAREIGPGVALGINVPASAVLGSGGGDGLLLDTLRTISAHLRGGTAADVDALRTTDLRALDAGLAALTSTRAGIGASANRLETAASRLAELEESVIGLLSETEDADMARTLTDFSTQQSVYQSALRSGANLVQSSLLDFLR